MNTESQALPATPYTVVLGLGDTGSSVVRFLIGRGDNVVVIDTRIQPPGLEAFQEEYPQVSLYLGHWEQVLLECATKLVLSPGLAPDDALMVAVRQSGAPTCSDIDLFFAEVAAPVIGITGSNAKSTVTTLLGLMAERSGLRVAVGGNLGTAALDLLDPLAELYVLELSSFQLEYSAEPPLAVACLLNVTEDHLDWHGDMAAYVAAKQRIYTKASAAVFNRDDAASAPRENEHDRQTSFSLSKPDSGEFGVSSCVAGERAIYRGDCKLLGTAEIAMVGQHNLANALAALAVGELAGLDEAAMLAELRRFPGLPHRGELIAIMGGVRWINDSKATNVGATRAALDGLAGEGKIVLIAGGQSKGADFTALRPPLTELCRGLILIGEAAAELEQVLGGSVATLRAISMAAAVSTAAEIAHPGDTVLLSPACASFDMFSGFADRGSAFVDCVRALEATS